LSYIVEKGWLSDIQDVFMIIQGVPNRWTFAGGCTVNADDYDRCLTKVEIEKSRAIPDKQVIHRSRKTRAAFFDAANQADGEVITLLQLKESMFDLGFLDVSDMRWRTPTKTSRQKGK